MTGREEHSSTILGSFSPGHGVGLETGQARGKAEMYKHILIATDGSALAQKGLEHGLELASCLGAATTIITVTEHWSALLMANEAQFARSNPVDQFRKQMEDHARRLLEAAEATARAKGMNVKTIHVADMNPAEGIIQTALDIGCDLIVMASHGRRGAKRMILGSQTAEVVTHTTIPVLVIR